MDHVVVRGKDSAFHGIFDIASLNAAEWFIALGCAFAVIPLVEIKKLIEKLIAKAKKNK